LGLGKSKMNQRNRKPDTFKNDARASNGMRDSSRIQVPLLCIDNSDTSKKAITSLKKSKKVYDIRPLTKQSEKEELRPPVLFSVEGVFRGVNAIDAYATSSLLGVRR
jgi:hypothetical protein